jgi:acyl-CoA synthetase (AMP-forming)/AMP-acid ligase II
MGLVGCLLFSLVHGLELWLLRPETFLARPATWLRTISAHRGRYSPGPNFAYQLCADRIDPEEIAGVDLSCWSSAMIGAEMIRVETCAAFVDKFNPFGFGRRQWRPCYGMAEATLAATFDRQCMGIRTRTTGGENSLQKEAVCTGPSVMHTTIEISSCAQPGDFLGEGSIGEVWLKGPGVFAGYYNDPVATAETIHNGWLRTGDLGFMKDGELYVTGRIKDVLIIHGHNWMPHELEREADAATGAGGAERSCAFSIDAGPEGEQPVLVIEIGGAGDKLAELEHAVRSRVGRALGLPLADVVLVKRGQIPKTTSGKVQRGEMRRRYLEGKIERLKP